MSLPQDPSPRSSGTDARDAVAAVLRDQAERAQRRDEPAPATVDRGPLLRVLFVVLLGATVWLLLAPPAFLRPDPIPPPSSEELHAGLRMDVWVAALSLARYRARHERWPTTLDEALENPDEGEDLVYERLPGDRYRLTGQRDGLVVVYESDEPLDRLTEPARRLVRGEGDG